MAVASSDQAAQWRDLLEAAEFVEQYFARWQKEGRLRPDQLNQILLLVAHHKEKWKRAQHEGLPVPDDTGLPAAAPSELPTAHSLRRWLFMDHQIDTLVQAKVVSLAQAHDLQAEARERQAALRRRLEVELVPEVLPIEKAEPSTTPKASAGKKSVSGRNLLEILLEPQNIQWLLALGGALMVLGLVILLWVNELLKPPVVAVGLGIINGSLLVTGWWVLRSTRFQLAGRALTLLACLVMPLNLWYYHTNGLITLDGHLWVAALVMSALYAVSARVLRDELFVYVFMGGVTLTGLLILADLPPSPQKFWEIASPATLLVALGLAAIHTERAFADQEGPFSRKRFGLAFFWSGHAVLAAGLLLVLGAQIAGDWLYQPVFEPLYRNWQAQPSPIVNELRLLALALVLAGTYAYIYSDVIVRRVGMYIYCAAFTLLWSQVLILEQLHLELGASVWIAVLAVTALIVHVVQATLLRDSRYGRAFPVFGVVLDLAAVLIGVIVSFRAISVDLRSAWRTEEPSWYYIGAMLLTALSSRVAAHLHRRSTPFLAAVSLFSTAAAILVGATAFLAVVGLNLWQQHAPWLMLIPIAYLIAAHLYRGQPEEQPLTWVSHAATVVMLASSLASSLEGFTRIVQGQPLNLALALFFAEAALFYGLTAALRRQVVGIHLCAAMACATVWQLLTYLGVEGEYYTLTFALVGLGLLLAYRFAVLERFAAGRLADAAYQSANTLLSLSFIAAAFMGLSRLATREISWSFVGLCSVLTLISLLAVGLVRQANWRRWYVVTTIGQALLTFMVVEALSTLSPWQKLEIFCVAAGLLLLVFGHVGWYREQERQSDLVSVSLLLGSLLAGIPLAIATLIDRSQDHFIVLNELGFLAVALLLLTTGFLFQLKATTLSGAVLTVLYFMTLVIYVPWSRLNSVAIFITVGGGLLFGTGLILSIYRDRLMGLPEKIKRRQGLFRVLSWR